MQISWLSARESQEIIKNKSGSLRTRCQLRKIEILSLVPQPPCHTLPLQKYWRLPYILLANNSFDLYVISKACFFGHVQKDPLVLIYFLKATYDAVTCCFCCVTDDATVTDLWEKHFSTLSTVCIMLDDKDCPYNYKHLASRLGISASTLRKFKYGDSSESPSMVVLKKLETQKPNLSTDDMVVALNSLGLETIAKELKCRPPGG